LEAARLDTRRRLAWAARHFLWIFVIAAVAGAGIAVAARLASGTKYRTSALVVAKTLTLQQQQLPHFGQAVFTSGAVADAVSADLGGSVRPETLIPNSINVVPLPDTVLFEVQGTASNPTAAAKLADSAATAFVRELNKAGPGVGTFALQDTAERPAPALSSGPGIVTLAVLGAVAGLLFALGIVVLILVIRRPLVSETEAVGLVDVPVVPVVLDVKDGNVSGGGIALLARTAFPSGHGRCAIVSLRGSRNAQKSVASLLARYSGASTFETNGTKPQTVAAAAIAPSWPKSPAGAAPEQAAVEQQTAPVVLVGPEFDAVSDLPAVVSNADRRLLVAEAGVGERAFSAAYRSMHHELDGIVFVKSPSPRRVRKARPT
jgi:capsular polysaccharide biosynthesis protein